MSAKQETNMEKLNRHRADLARCYAAREKLNERIARLEERVNQEENQEYLQIVHSANISLDDLRMLMKDKAREKSTAPLSVATDDMDDMKEEDENKDEKK